MASWARQGAGAGVFERYFQGARLGHVHEVGLLDADARKRGLQRVHARGLHAGRALGGQLPVGCPLLLAALAHVHLARLRVHLHHAHLDRQRPRPAQRQKPRGLLAHGIPMCTPRIGFGCLGAAEAQGVR